MPPVVYVGCYRPKPGKEAELLALVRRHVPALRAEGLATERPATILRSFEDGTILEIAEWRSEEASRSAHDNPRVQALWEAFAEVCEFLPLSALPECRRPFAHFEALDDLPGPGR